MHGELVWFDVGCQDHQSQEPERKGTQNELASVEGEEREASVYVAFAKMATLQRQCGGEVRREEPCAAMT